MYQIRLSKNLRCLRCFPKSRCYSTLVTGSGNQGVEGRLPFNFLNPEQEPPPQSAITITDPFIIYQNYIRAGILQKDESQLRVMKQFQKLYHRVIDYHPPEELSIQLSLLIRKIQIKHAESEIKQYGKFSPLKYSAIRNLFNDVESHKRALVNYMSDEDHLHTFASPQGLLVNGGVGCGKSMLMDIFAACLPHKSKMRWHYNNFILWVFSEMHKIQQERMLTATLGNGRQLQQYTMENEFILYEIAQKMISKNTILILDEFVLPDIAAANIVKILFTYYFKLGGVLVATSNKLPEDLYSNQFHRKNFVGFLQILNSRCQHVDMNSDKDYRSSFANESSSEPNLIVKKDNDKHETQWLDLIKVVVGVDKATCIKDLGGKPAEITVYNRKISIPLTFNNIIAYLDFGEICQGLHSSSDYITIASHYKTIILDNVPIMTTSKKNEARRFITLLDAIYECKCQLFIRCEVDIDYLFFPDVLNRENKSLMEYLQTNHFEINNNLEVQDEEMFAKTSIALMNPYRPNISTYDTDHTKTYDDYEQVQRTNYKNLKAFTGDDEKFAFKRAVSRIKEMVNSDSWRKFDRWIPLDNTMRPWETIEGKPTINISVDLVNEDVNSRIDNFLTDHPIKDLTKNELLHSFPRDYAENNGLPFRQFNAKVAPMFKSLQHFWAMGVWTKEQGQRTKDGITKSWIRSSIRSDK